MTTATTPPIDTHAAAAQYRRDGYYFTPPVIPQDLLDRAITHMDMVIAGQFETGVGPSWSYSPPGAGSNKLVKFDQPQQCDRTIAELIRHPAIGRWAAALTGAKWIQAWAVQLLLKPPGGKDLGNVGWHQDTQYWNTWFTPDSELLTCWLPLTEVRPESGPMLLVPGSHRWGFLDQGDFFASNQDELRGKINVPTGEKWEEVPTLLPGGALSFHHRLTYHGSGTNVSDLPRRSFAIHLRTENSRPADLPDPHYYVKNLTNYDLSPVIFGG